MPTAMIGASTMMSCVTPADAAQRAPPSGIIAAALPTIQIGSAEAT
jgi:hypothetical protein